MMLLHSFLNFMEILLVILIAIELFKGVLYFALRAFETIFKTAKMFWKLKHDKNRITLIYSLLSTNSLSTVKESESLQVPYKRGVYLMTENKNVLNVDGITLNLEGRAQDQLQPFVKESLRKIEEDSQKLMFKQSMINSCRGTERMIGEIQKLLDKR